MTQGQFVVDLIRSLPDAAPLVAVHLDDQDGELLLHLLVADLRRLVLAAREQHSQEVVAGTLNCLERAMTTGDEYVKNAVAVSFVEDIQPWHPSMQGFVDSWPPGLAAEAMRQRSQAGQGC